MKVGNAIVRTLLMILLTLVNINFAYLAGRLRDDVLHMRVR
jgi:hypothetical protein